LAPHSELNKTVCAWMDYWQWAERHA